MTAPPIFDDAHSQAAQALDRDFRRACARLQVDEPWFGAFALAEAGKVHDYRLGKRRSVELKILPWQHPYARAFYECQPGAPVVVDADESLGFRPVDGALESKARVVAHARRLERVELERRDGASTWLRRGDCLVDEADSFREAMARHGLPDVLSLLTTEQYRLITASRARPVVLQGRAGSGKTTVALHRVSWLTHPDAAADAVPVDPSRVLMVMFNRALSAFVETSLAPLGLEAVKLNTFHGWAWEAITAAYAGRLELQAGPSEGHGLAASLKKQLGMLAAVEAYVERQTGALLAWFQEESAKVGDTTWAKLLRNGDGPIIGRLADVRRRLTRARDESRGAQRKRLDEVVTLVQRARRRMTLYKEDLLRLLLDRELLRRHLTVTEAELAVLEAYQRELQGFQGDARSPGPGIAFEDLALLLRLIQLKHGGLAAKDADDVVLYEHLVIDEAQDFGAVELKTLLSAVRARTGVTVVGDLNQKIIPEADFVGWDALAEELGLGGAQVARLEVAHRSSRPIVELAGSIIPDGTPTGGPGPRPTLSLLPGASVEVVHAAIAAQAEAMLAEVPGAHVAVVFGNRDEAREARPKLAALLPGHDVRIGHNKEFSFAPGVTVTNVRQVKGLEFDGVIVVEPSAQAFPDSEQGRRWLYTVITRAKRFLAMVRTGELTPLLGPAQRDGLIEVAEAEVTAAFERGHHHGDGAPL